MANATPCRGNRTKKAVPYDGIAGCFEVAFRAEPGWGVLLRWKLVGRGADDYFIQYTTRLAMASFYETVGSVRGEGYDGAAGVEGPLPFTLVAGD